MGGGWTRAVGQRARRKSGACRHRRSAALLCFAAASLVVLPDAGWASGLLAPAVGAADSATAGTRVADPLTPSSSLFSNPAGLTRFDSVTVDGSFGLGYGWMQIDASQPAGYDESNDFFAGVPALGLSIPYRDHWRFGFGAFGTTGSRFDFKADPDFGLGDFFSETILVSAPLGVAYRVSDRLSVGAQIEPLFGQLRTHFAIGGAEFRYKLNGPGVQGAVGATFRLDDRWAFGLSVRTPGLIWMDGGMPIEGVGHQDVEVDLQMPTQVFLGATWRCTEELTLSGSVRFTDSSTLGDSTIEYELTPQANIAFLPDGKDEWKFALAAEYALREKWKLRIGALYASRIVGSEGVSPLVYDGEDVRVTMGVGREFGRLALDAMGGYAVPFERDISPETALLIPGKYKGGGGIFMLGLTYRFGDRRPI